MPPKLPPPHPHIIGAQRFFARARTFDLECPACGVVHAIREGAHRTNDYDPRTARFTCRECLRQFTIGLLAWPCARGKLANTPPADQVLGPRQLAQMREEGSSWWLPEEYRHKGRPDPTNLTGAEERPEPEDEVDLQLIDAEDAPICAYCQNPYRLKKSTAKDQQTYCTAHCEEQGERRRKEP